VCLPGQSDVVWRKFCERGKGWDAAGLEQIVERAADEAERRWPLIEFRVVELAPNRIKFIYAGRRGYNVEAPNLCPVGAQSQGIAEKVCSKQGHDIRVFQGQTRITQQGPVAESMNFCVRCGFSVNEVRGQVEAMYKNAVQQGVQEMIARHAASQVPAPVGEPGIHLADAEPPKAAVAEA